MPHIADMKPHGKYHMVDLDRIGGVPVVMRELLDAGLLHGDCLTVTGKTMAENLAELDPPKPDGEVVHPLSAPIHAQGGIAVLRGIARAEGRRREGRRHRRAALRRHRARVRRRGRARWRRSSPGKINAGDIVVIRYEGPKGGPGMREMLAVTGAMKGAGRGARRRAHHRRSVLAAAPTASASGTSRPRRSTAARSRSSPTATAS